MRNVFVYLIILLAFQAESQNLTSANPARLQVYLSKANGEQIMLATDQFDNQYNKLTMFGELDICNLIAGDEEIQALLDTCDYGIVKYWATIPEGQFVFHNTDNYTFTSEAELYIGEKISRFILHFDISNIKTEVANTFFVICSGSLSLEKDLGIVAIGGIQDQISFQFTQNVRSLTY